MSGTGKRMLREMREIVHAAKDSSSEQPSPFQSGVDFFVNEEFEQAINAFREAIDLSPDFAFSHYYLGRCFRRVELYEEAVASLCRAVELNPLHAPSHAYLGNVFLLQGRTVEADQYFRRALQLQFDNVTALSGLVDLHKTINADLDEVAELLKNAYLGGAKNPILLMELFSLESPRSEFCLQVADDLAAQSAYRRALFFYRLALRKDPKNKLLQDKIDDTLKYLSIQ